MAVHMEGRLAAPMAATLAAGVIEAAEWGVICGVGRGPSLGSSGAGGVMSTVGSRTNGVPFWRGADEGSICHESRTEPGANGAAGGLSRLGTWTLVGALRTRSKLSSSGVRMGMSALQSLRPQGSCGAPGEGGG